MAVNEGLKNKFHVYRLDGRDLPGGDRVDSVYFVLDLVHDKFAKPAIENYIKTCADEYPALATDLLLLLNGLDK